MIRGLGKLGYKVSILVVESVAEAADSIRKGLNPKLRV